MRKTAAAAAVSTARITRELYHFRARTDKKPFCQLLSVIYKHLCHLIALSLFISARADFSFIKRKDFRSRDPQQDRRVRRDDKLRSRFRHLCDPDKQCQLTLRGQRCLRLIHQINPPAGKRLEECQEALSVRLTMERSSPVHHGR